MQIMNKNHIFSKNTRAQRSKFKNLLCVTLCPLWFKKLIYIMSIIKNNNTHYLILTTKNICTIQNN